MLYTEFPLDERLQRALATAGFVSPTPIQAAAMPVALEGKDLVGTAQTGTGKTAAFVLPILQQLISIPLETRRTRAVILAPTRELVEQILAVVRELGVHTNIRAIAVYGGVAMQPQTRALRAGVELVVACPGRLLDHIKRRNAELRELDTLVLDEADRMLDMGFLPSIQEIIDALPAKRQTVLYSATFPRTLNAFVKKTLNDPVRVEVDTAVPAQTVRHTQYQVKGSMKTAQLTTLLRQLAPESDSVLIFTRTRVTANQLSDHLYAEGMRADVLHAEKTQRARQDTLDHFRAGRFTYLVATDIAARGIDVASISHVINYDLPARPDDYLHRIGRTGRMERTGHAISLVTKGDMRALRDIEHMLGKRMEVAYFDGSAPRPMSDETPIAHESTARPKHHVATHATHATIRPPKPHHRDEEARPRYAQRDVAPAEPSPRAERPERRPRADAPQRDDRPRRTYQPDAPSAAPARAERPERRRTDVSFPGAADRTKRARYTDAPPARSDRPRKQFGSESPATGRPPRPERADRPRRDRDVSAAPKRWDRAGDNRFAEAPPSRAPRQERTDEAPITGTAPAHNYQRRKHAPGKRQPGEIASSPRPHGKSAAVHQAHAPAATHSARPKRATRHGH
ncbi:MAG TPA: DEAD/DEAH box helicase [Armatimonadota bacterium]|jgi:ATP-dependent RNA helicase RhlE